MFWNRIHMMGCISFAVILIFKANLSHALRIDTHSHFLPPEYVESTRNDGGLYPVTYPVGLLQALLEYFSCICSLMSKGLVHRIPHRIYGPQWHQQINSEHLVDFLLLQRQQATGRHQPHAVRQFIRLKFEEEIPQPHWVFCFAATTVDFGFDRGNRLRSR